jgi:hypothetical protein
MLPMLMGIFGGMTVQIVDAQTQKRTPRDVRGQWVRPKLPSKVNGRRGTRRAWKRKNSPHYIMLYHEPSDVLVIANQMIIATPLQADALRRACVVDLENR